MDITYTEMTIFPGNLWGQETMDANASLEKRFDFVGMKIDFDPNDRLSMETWFNVSHQINFETLASGAELQSYTRPSQNIYFLASGIAREYALRPDGVEINRAFHRPHTVLGSLDSYNNKTNNASSIQLITLGEVFSISCEKLAQLMESHHDLRTWYRLIICRQGANLQNRLSDMLSKDESQRLQEFVAESPDLVRTVPTQHLSNYLGVPSVVVNLVKKKVGVDVDREIA